MTSTSPWAMGLALAAVRNRMAYTGFAYTAYHEELVMARLLDLVSAGALQAGDKWYDPNLVKTLTSVAKTKNTIPGGDTEDGPPHEETYKEDIE